MKIKTFECGICKRIIKRENYTGTRKGLRKHLREEHFKKHNLKNIEDSKGNKIIQDWWIER